MDKLCRLLIVDDELILRNGLRYLCNWEAHDIQIVGEAANGEEALELVEELQPHIVLVDIVMPMMNGVEFAKIMQEKHPQVRMIVLSSFSEFDYVREAFKYGVSDYLLKPKLKVEDLLTLIEKVKGEMDLSSKQVVKKDNTSSLLKQLLNPFHQEVCISSPLEEVMPEPNFILMKCKICDSYKEELVSWVHHALKNINFIETIIQEEYIVLANLKHYDERIFLHTLREAVSYLTLDKVNFIVSSIFINPSSLIQISNELSQLLAKAFYFKEKTFILQSEMKKEGEKKEFDIALFNSTLNGLDMESCKKQLLDYYEEVKKEQGYDEYSLKRFCQNVIYNLINTTSHLGFDISLLSKDKIRIFRDIDKATYFEELVEVMKQVFEKLTTLMNEQVEQKNSVILSKVIQYVEKHYSEDFTLSDIANDLHINYYYLSAYFKNQTSENLTAYINKVRVEKAKLLLKDEKLSIAEVSGLVGFSEHNYFSKIFKKYATMTPTSYRRKQVGWGK